MNANIKFLVAGVLALMTMVHNAHMESVDIVQCPRSCELQNDKVLCCESRDCTDVPSSEVSEVYYSEEIHYRSNKVLNVTHMDKFYNLKYLDLSNNLIGTIMDDAFDRHSYLTRLNLAYNKLATLRQAYFTGLPMLMELNLSGNNLEYIGDNVFFDTVKSLKSLHLSQNKLRSITHNAFTDLPNLKYLHLDDNLLEELEQAYFLGLDELEDLNLNGNLFTALPEGSFRECGNLRLLDLGNNMIKDIHNGAFRNLVKLQRLNLERNRLENITAGMFDGMTDIDTLYLDDNPLKTIDSGALPISLMKISLQRQPHLQMITNGTFTGLTKLTTVEITSSKMLRTIEGGAFDGVDSVVHTLNLNNNSLTSLPEELLNWTMVLHPVLSANEWICDCTLAWMKHSNDLTEEDKKQVVCHEPYHLRGSTVLDVDFTQFSCAFFNVHRRGIEVGLIIFVTVLFVSIMGSLGYKFRHSLFPCCFVLPGQYRTHYDAISTEDNDSIKIKFGESTGLHSKTSEKERIIPGPTPV